MADVLKPVRCPICRRAAAPRFQPFCSVRCADVDLGRWFTEDYRIPATAPDVQIEADRDDHDQVTG